MPLVSNDDEAPLADLETPDVVHLTQPFVQPTNYRSAVVDTRFQSLASLLTYVEGSPWTIDYFSRVVGADEELSNQQVNQSPVYEQYINIHEMEIRVQDPLSQSTNTETNELEIVGSAVVYPYIIPNAGDMFLADIGDGREGIFAIKTVERKTIFKESAYLISYSLIAFSDSSDGITRRADLIAKTVTVQYFKKNFLQTGKTPILIEEDALNLDRMQKRYHSTIRNYIAEFLNHEVKTLTVPNDEVMVTYDDGLVRFLLSIVDLKDHPEMKQIRTINTNDALDQKSTFSLWSMMLECDYSMMPVLSKKWWAITTRAFSYYPAFMSARYSGATHVAFPSGRMPDSTGSNEGGEDLYVTLTTDEYSAWVATAPNVPGYEVPIDLVGNQSFIPYGYLPVRKDDYYVLSEGFYTNTPQSQSVIELLLRGVLKGETINPNYVISICDSTTDWAPIDRFYLVPVLIYLLRAAMNRL